MRTTIRLGDALLREAEREASRSGMTLTAFIEESLRQRLARNAACAEPHEHSRLRTTGSGGLHPGIDLDDSAALLDVVDRAD